jgi:hypothetical protein
MVENLEILHKVKKVECSPEVLDAIKQQIAYRNNNRIAKHNLFAMASMLLLLLCINIYAIGNKVSGNKKTATIKLNLIEDETFYDK